MYQHRVHWCIDHGLELVLVYQRTGVLNRKKEKRKGRKRKEEGEK